MVDWRKVLGNVTTNVEEYYDTLKMRFKQRFNLLDPLVVLPYRGHGNPTDVYVRGRVLEHQGITGVSVDDSAWDNLLNMYRRFTSDEIAGARVHARFHDREQEVVTDADGYFNVHIKPTDLPHAESCWYPMELELLEPKAAGQGVTRAIGEVLIPPPTAEFCVISDIDDTVVKTNSTELLKMARIVFLGNAHTRIPFAGVAAFYQALQAGSDGTHYNPIFYVSSSAWNLYDLFVDFFALHDIPRGPLFLRDFSLDDERFISLGHMRHKLERIRPLFETYPQLPFILIGDSGQKDPEIYQELVQAYPGRVLAIYIRDVVGVERQQEVKAIAAKMQAQGVEMVLVPDTFAAAEHAARHGFIRPSAKPMIAKAKSQDEQAPSTVEQLLDSDGTAED